MKSVGPEPDEQRVKYTAEQADTLLEIYLRFAELGRQELARHKPEAEQQRKAEDAESDLTFVSHYPLEDDPRCADALLLLAGLDGESQP